MKEKLLTPNEKEFLNNIRKAQMRFVSKCETDDEFLNPHAYVKKIWDDTSPIISRFVNEVLNNE